MGLLDGKNAIVTGSASGIGRGIALERGKKWDAAEKDFKKALELRPDEPSVLNYLGYSYLDRGVNLVEARKLIESAYRQRPNDGYIIDSFMVVVFGGVGNLWGTLVAALTLGVANKFLEPLAGAVLGKIVVLVFIILFIQKRPRGLFALKGRAVEA